MCVCIVCACVFLFVFLCVCVSARACRGHGILSWHGCVVYFLMFFLAGSVLAQHRFLFCMSSRNIDESTGAFFCQRRCVMYVMSDMP